MKTVWNKSEGRTSQSDGANILVTKSEITVDFCSFEEARDAADAESASVVARIVMNPHMTKRLAGTLVEVLRKHESLYGSIDEKSLAGGKLLHDMVRDLGVPHGIEYSFKMCEGVLLADRFLITLGKDSLGPDYQRRVMELGKKLRAPAAFLEAMEGSISKAHMLHFGFEGSEKGGMHKVYLEYPLSTLTTPTLLHTSYKWDPIRPQRRAIGSYVRHPLLSYDETAARLRDLLAGCRKPGAFEIADEFLRLAMPRLKKSFHYLEVTEEGTPRRSFDVNFYSASLTMSEIRPLLLRLAERYCLSVEEFGARLDSVEKKKFGHLTGGIDREGRDFFTIHFGVKPRRR
jgi:hypothetical protein